MKERPILFSGAMVRAILDGRKTQTRRVVKPQPLIADPDSYGGARLELGADGYGGIVQENVNGTYTCPVRCPYGVPGDRLWVREAWSMMNADRTTVVLRGHHRTREEAGELDVVYAATEPHDHRGWRPSIHMPRWASRLTLEVTGVRVERLHDITGEDARAEGIEVPRCACEVCARTSAICTADASEYVQGFASLWREINGAESWAANPWVWVVEFRRVP